MQEKVHFYLFFSILVMTSFSFRKNTFTNLINSPIFTINLPAKFTLHSQNTLFDYYRKYCSVKLH